MRFKEKKYNLERLLGSQLAIISLKCINISHLMLILAYAVTKV